MVSIKDSIPEILKTKNITIKKENGSLNTKEKHGKWEVYIKNKRIRGFYNNDTINPIISEYNLKNHTNTNNVGNISVKILDNESGISYYRGEIDGEWILMDYDFKSDLLIYYIEKDKLQIGEHTLKITVRDRMDNETVFIKNFSVNF